MGPYTNAWSFVNGTEINPPVPPTANSATNITQTSFTANWSESSGATGYRLDVSTNSGFTSFVSGYNNLDVGNVTNRSVTGLNASTTYYYRLRAYNSSGTSGNSNTINVVSLVNPPLPPLPTSPSNGSTGTATNPTLSWNVSSGAIIYRLQVSSNSNFTVTVYDQSNITDTSEQVIGLSNGTHYYWRVNATNAGGTSDWSEIWNFTTLFIYDISISSNPINGGSTFGSGQYLQGDTATIKAIPNIGWIFINWTENETMVSTDTIYSFEVSKNRTFIANFDSVETGIHELSMINGIVNDYFILNNYPNPFNPVTSIEFGIPEESNNTLKVYDITGRLVQVLLENEILPKGKFKYEFNAMNLPSGVYIYVLTSSSNVSNKSFNNVKKMILLK